MKKITIRLIQQFVGLLLIFATMSALFFGILFAKQTEDLHQEEMTHRSELISATLSDYFTNGSRTGQKGGGGGYGAFLRFINQIAGENVWVLDSKMNTIINYHHEDSINQESPPDEAKSIMAKTFASKQTQVTKKEIFFNYKN